MIELSIWKLFIVMLVALIVLGPEHLPKAARNLGRLIKQFKAVSNTVQKEIKDISFDEKKENDNKTKDNL